LALFEVERGVATRFTTSATVNEVWSPDSRTLVYTSGAPFNLFRKMASGAGSQQRLTDLPNLIVTDWSLDGRYLIGNEGPLGSHRSIWIRTAAPDDLKPQQYLQTSFNNANGHFSPDTRWVAFESDESGQSEIYVDAVPEPRGKVRISTHGGTFPSWGPGALISTALLGATSLCQSTQTCHPWGIVSARSMVNIPVRSQCLRHQLEECSESIQRASGILTPSSCPEARRTDLSSGPLSFRVGADFASGRRREFHFFASRRERAGLGGVDYQCSERGARGSWHARCGQR